MQNILHEAVITFLKSSQVANICVVENGEPYCFSCFYAYSAFDNFPLLLFKSAADTSHAKKIMANNRVAGTILPNKIIKTAVQGIQFGGSCEKLHPELQGSLTSNYYMKYPLGLAVKGDLWVIYLHDIKFTNTELLGFGKKLRWSKEEVNV